MERVKRLVRARPDPLTGDLLSFGEQVSWVAQGLIRRWLFMGVVSGGSGVWWWLRPFGGGEQSLMWWNLLASLLAIQVESIVGLGMFNQTRRDAVLIRRQLRELGELRAGEAAERAQVDEILADVRELLRSGGCSRFAVGGGAGEVSEA